MKLPILALISILFLPSCSWLQQNVPIVQDRNPDGTFKATKDVLHPVTGATPIGSGRIYLYPQGNVAVSGNLTYPLTGKTLKLKH